MKIEAAFDPEGDGDFCIVRNAIPPHSPENKGQSETGNCQIKSELVHIIAFIAQYSQVGIFIYVDPSDFRFKPSVVNVFSAWAQHAYNCLGHAPA